jgi:DNA topoisomerase I
VAVKGNEVRLSFPAKSGKRSIYKIIDERLADAIARIKAIPGNRLLMYINGAGGPQPIRSDELNAYLKEITGVPVSAKDFRTLHASALAGEALAALEPSESERARKRQVAEVIKRVAAFLQNTPAICRKSYVAPCLIDLFEKRALSAVWVNGADGGHGLRQREARLAAVLAAV